MAWQRLAHVLGIIPFSDWRCCKYSVSSRIKLCVMLFGTIFLPTWLTYTKISEKFYKNKKLSSNVMSVLSAVVLMLSAMVCFVQLGIVKRKSFHTFLVKLDQVDANLKKKTHLETETSLQFCFKAVLLHVFVFIASVLSILHMSLRYNKYVALAQVMKEIEIYYVSVLMMLIYNYSACVAIQFRKMNSELKNASVDCARGFYVKVRNLAKSYLVLLDVLDLFNLVFGWQLLALVMKLVVDTLFLISTAVAMVSFHTAQFAVIPTVVLVLKALLSWVLVFLLAMSCNKVTKEFRKTIIVTYKLMQELRSMKYAPEIRLVHDELFLLTQKIFSISPHVNAAGFFPVDYNLLFTCMSCITSYLIVLIQFNK